MGDALLTQRQLSVRIVQVGGDYIWLAKDNQPYLRETIAHLFMPPTRTSGWGIPPNDFQTARVQSKGHGRLEERILTSSELLNDHLDWPHLGQVFRLERRRTKLKDGCQQTEVVYGLTSLCRQRASAADLLAFRKSLEGEVRNVDIPQESMHNRSAIARHGLRNHSP